MNSRLDLAHLFNNTLSIVVKLKGFMDNAMFDTVSMVIAMVG